MGRWHYILGAALAFAGTASAQAQTPQIFCDNMRRIVAAAGETKPFGSLLNPSGFAAFKPAPDIKSCAYNYLYNHTYTCDAPFAKAQMVEALNGIGNTLAQCFGGEPSPGPAEIGKLPSLSWFFDGDVSVHLYPREDWGQYADDAGDEEFTRFGFDLVVARN